MLPKPLKNHKEIRKHCYKEKIMIVYTIRKFWSLWGWPIMFYGSLIALFILWIYNMRLNSGAATGSSSATWNSILQTIFSPSTTAPLIPRQLRHSSGSGGSSPSNHEPRQSKGERKCKEFLEYLFKKKFENTRPDFMINPITNQPLELDCYNEELRLAIEYNGRQHYEYNRMMHQNSKYQFHNMQYRDHIKKELCEKNGIRLIIVPYSVKEDDIPDFLYSELKKLGFIHPMFLNDQPSLLAEIET